MRDYRGKSQSTGEWIFGSLISWPDGEMDICHEEADLKCELTKAAIRPKTVGQYTGIHTMEEIEGGDTRCTFIYEGDIVEAVLIEGTHIGFSWGRHVVVFDRGAFCLKSRRGEITPMCNYSANVKFKVLGNVFDNPELWEVSE